MLYRIRKRVLVFHSAQEGQAIVFVALFCLVMALFAFMLINIGYITGNRMEAQNSADAVALSSAAWIARGLNFETMCNVTNAQILAFIIIIDAMEPTNIAIEVVAQIQMRVGNALQAIPWTAPIGVALYTCGQISDAYKDAVLDPLEDTLSQLTENKYDSALWKAMKGINKIQEIAKKGFPIMAIARAVTVARENGSDLGVIIPFYQPLPVKRKDFEEFCVGKSSNYNPWGRATPQWLNTFQVIPLLLYAPTITSLGPAIYFAVLHTMKLLYCKTLSATNTDGFIPDGNETDCTKCNQYKSSGKLTKTQWEIYTIKSAKSSWVESSKKNEICNGFPVASWGTVKAECRNKDGCGTCVDCKDSTSQSYPPSGFGGAEKGTHTDETGKSHCYYKKTACDAVDSRTTQYQCGTYEDGSPKYCTKTEYIYQRATRFAYHTYCEYKRTTQDMLNESGVNLDGEGVQDTQGAPVGYVLDGDNNDDIQKKLQYLGIARGSSGQLEAYIGKNIFENPNPLGALGVVTFAQAEVYNATSMDLWTMDWRVRLVPSKMIMGDGSSVEKEFVPLH
jgi:hypothetical protein